MLILDAAAGASVANALVLLFAVPTFVAWGLVFLVRFTIGSIEPGMVSGGGED